MSIKKVKGLAFIRLNDRSQAFFFLENSILPIHPPPSMLFDFCIHVNKKDS
jgi:hypothetical protein